MAVRIERPRPDDEDAPTARELRVAKQTRRATTDPRNVVDPEMVIEGMAHLLRVWELNRRHRQDLARRGRVARLGDSSAERMRGLFGGG